VVQQAAVDAVAAVAGTTAGPAQDVDPITLVDLAGRAFSILAEFGASLYSSQPWAQHLLERSAMVSAVAFCLSFAHSPAVHATGYRLVGIPGVSRGGPQSTNQPKLSYQTALQVEHSFCKLVTQFTKALAVGF